MEIARAYVNEEFPYLEARLSSLRDGKEKRADMLFWNGNALRMYGMASDTLGAKALESLSPGKRLAHLNSALFEMFRNARQNPITVVFSNAHLLQYSAVEPELATRYMLQFAANYDHLLRDGE